MPAAEVQIIPENSTRMSGCSPRHSFEVERCSLITPKLINITVNQSSAVNLDRSSLMPDRRSGSEPFGTMNTPRAVTRTMNSS